MTWQFTLKKKTIKKPVFIEGLPGIGNVGKLTVDFLVDELKAEHIGELFSYSLPHVVFVTEDNLVELPKLNLYHKKINKQDFVFLTGDIPPVEETFELCEVLLKQLKKWETKLVITTGGIGLQEVPDNPSTYITGNNKKAVATFRKGHKISQKIAGVVGSIIGVTGVLIGLASEYERDAVCLLTETFAHPLYLEVKGAKNLIKIFEKKYSLGIDIKNLEKELGKLEKATIKRAKDISSVKPSETSYIG